MGSVSQGSAGEAAIPCSGKEVWKQMSVQQVIPQPGPCDPVFGCPPPTEIVCIRTEKVYDFCFEQELGLQHCVPVPTSCGTIPSGSTATCSIDSVTCTASPPVPIPGQDGFSTVRKTIVIQYDIVIRNPAGAVVCTINNNQFTFTRAVVVCGPVGTTADCEAFATCGNCVIVPPTGPSDRPDVCCEFNLCVIVETTAPVKLLVPAYGFCVPAPCRTGGFPPFPCPPPLFPPQCTPVDG